MGTLYDELAATPALDPAPGGSLYDSLRAQEDQQRALRTSLTVTADRTPEQAAQLNHLSRATGLPRSVVETAEGEAKARAQFRELWDASADSPVLRARLANPTFTELAKDDVGVLAKIEQGVGSVAKYLLGADGRGGLPGDIKAGYHVSSAGAAGAFRGLTETLAVPFDFLEEFTGIGGNPLRRVAEGFAAIATEQSIAAKRSSPGVFGVSSGVQSLVQNSQFLPLVAAGPGGLTAALTGMVSMSFGTSFQKGRQEGLSEVASLIYAGSDAAVEYATERLPLSRLVGDLAVNTGFLKMLGRQVALEIPGEQVATILQDMNEWAVINPERSFRDYLNERPSAAAETLIATVIGAGGNVALAKTIDTALMGYMGEQLRQTEAGEQAVLLEQQLQVALQSKLRERDPDQFRETVAEMARQAGTESIFVDAVVLNQIPREVLAQLPGVEEQLADALATNAVVELKLADVLTVAPGTGIEQVLAQNARMAPDALTALEATQAGEQAQQLLAQQAQSVIDQAANAVQVQASAEMVKAEILKELTATGRFSKEVNDAYATLVRDFYTVLGHRLGVSAQQAFDRYRLRVAQQTSAGALLDQDVPLQQTSDPAFAKWFGESKVVDKQGKPLVVYHGSPDARFLNEDGVFATMKERMLRFGATPESKQAAAEERAFFFTTSRPVAQTYANPKRAFDYQNAEPDVVPTYVSMQNPLEYDAGGKHWREAQAAISKEDFIKAAKKAGHDGVIIRNVRDSYDSLHTGKDPLSDVIVAFQSNQIKHADKNDGTFDANDPNIFSQSAADPAADIATTLLELGKAEDLFQYPKSTSADMAEIAAAKDLTVKPVDPNTEDNNEWMLANTVPDNADEAWMVGIPSSDRLATITRRGNEVWVNVSGVGEGAGGSRVYDLAANYALNNGLKFVGDPAGVSPAAMRRRLENMLSSAIKYGTTDHLAPHPDQQIGDPRIGVRPLEWTEGDTLGNIRSMVEASIAATESAAPVTTSNVTYNAASRQFELPDGARLDGADVAALLDFEGGVRGAGAPGRSTVQRAALLKSLLQGPDERRAVLVAVRGQQGAGGAGLGRTFYQDGVGADSVAQVTRGSFNPQTNVITLLQAADLSTFLHESGHFFLEVMADIAAQPGAPAEVQTDMAALLKWFGVADLATWQAMTLEQKRPHHERFAESFEQYLMEGRAPNRELRPLFRKFRAYLTRVYRSLQALTGRGHQLSDDVRQVMDRMLATDEQIAEAEKLAAMAPDQDATEEAVERLQARSLRDLKWAVNARARMIRKLQEQAKGVRKVVEDEVRAEVEQMPEVRAKAALDALRKSTPEYKAQLAEWKTRREKALEEATEAVASMLLTTEGADLVGIKKGQFLAKNKRRIANEAEGRALAWERENPKPERQIVGSDLEIATLADSFGYPSVEAMLAAINEFGRKEDVIEGLTGQRMIERHADLADQRAIEQAATEAIHNEARARALATELTAQRDLLTNRKATGETDKAGRPITVNATLEAARQFAQDLTSRKKVKDLKAAAWAHLQAERRAAKAWEAATAKGDTQSAVQAKQDQLLNHEVYRALLAAQAAAEKADAFFAKILKGSEEKLVERGFDPDVVMASRAILGAYDLAPRGGQSPLEYLAKVEANDPEMYAVLRPAVEAAMAGAKPFPEITVGELDALVAELEAMQLLARRSRQMEVDGNLLDIAEAADQLKARMAVIGVPTEVPGESGALTKRQERVRFLQFAKALMRRIEQWAEGMDGGRGPFTKLVFGPVKAAADRYRSDRVQYRREYQKLLDKIAPALRKGPIAAPELGYTFGQGHNGIGHAELLHALLHTGNESNKRKLLLGRKWAVEQADGTLDTSKWDGFVERMQREGILAKEHYDFAQGVWDLLERTKPLAQKAHRDVFGRYFAEVTADAFDTPWGAYRGGYVPAQADPRIVTDAALRKLAEMENENMAFSFPTTSKGFTKSRTEYNRPLILDLRTIGQHLDKVLLFSHMEPAVRDVNRLLRAKGVSSSLSRIDPAAYEGALIPWLNRSARQQVETPIVGDGRIGRVLSVARNRAGMSLMFGNLSNTAQQITGFALAAVKVKPRLLLAAAAQYIAAPAKLTTFVGDTSIYMRDRMTNEVAAMHDAMEDILLDPSAYKRAQNWTKKHTYFLQAAVDNVMSPIVWTAAYNQALEAGETEAEAVKAADAAVRQTQGSTLPEDVSRIETGPAYARMFTQFLGYFNMVANTNGAELKKIADGIGLKKGAGKALYVVTLGLLVPAWVAQAIAVAFRGGPEDEDDDGYLDDWLAEVFGMGTIKGAFAMVPFVGLAANAALARANSNPTDDRVSLSPAVSLLEGAAGAPTSVYKAMVEDGSIRTAVRDVASLIGMVTGLPAVALARPLGYAAGVVDDRIDPTGPVDAARGLATGSASPASR